jgi:hypothetical protein
MALPNFTPLRARKQEEQDPRVREGHMTGAAASAGNSSERKQTPEATAVGVGIKSATRTTRNAIIVSSAFFFIAVIFLILVRSPQSNKEN